VLTGLLLRVSAIFAQYAPPLVDLYKPHPIFDAPPAARYTLVFISHREGIKRVENSEGSL